jgi:hypothetical protein
LSANANGTTFQRTTRDAGAALLRLRVRDMDTTFANLKAGGCDCRVGKRPDSDVRHGQGMVVMHDPNNFFVQPMIAPPLAAARLQ